MIADDVPEIDQFGAADARSLAARTLDDLIGRMRDIIRVDDPPSGGLPVSAAAGEKHQSEVPASNE